MATQEKTWNVANRLHSLKDSDNPEVNHIIAGADEIYDDAKGAKQSDINAQTDAALAGRYTKAETYSKEQLDSLITTPDVNYVTVATFADLPQTGEANTIYRVSSYDGTQVDASKYALYAWNGATYQLLAVRSAVGEVFDVSEYNSGATYETLASALAAVPESVQRGGMSIKFILRTNTGTEEEPVYHDEYVQYLLKKTEWSIVPSDWESTDGNNTIHINDAQQLTDTQKAQALANLGIGGIDNEPTAGSDNLVRSGGVQNELALGAVYDVSAKNPTAGPNNDGKFESLSALLSDSNLNTLIPTSVRKGGMSIKFVQSHDNTYVQFRLMKNQWSTTPSDWQGVDANLTRDSRNLAESGSVYEGVVQGSGIYPLYQGYTNNNGNVTPNNGRVTTKAIKRIWDKVYIACNENLNIQIITGSAANSLPNSLGNVSYNGNPYVLDTDDEYFAVNVVSTVPITPDDVKLLITGEGSNSAKDDKKLRELRFDTDLANLNSGNYNVFYPMVQGERQDNESISTGASYSKSISSRVVRIRGTYVIKCGAGFNFSIRYKSITGDSFSRIASRVKEYTFDGDGYAFVSIYKDDSEHPEITPSDSTGFVCYLSGNVNQSVNLPFVWTIKGGDEFRRYHAHYILKAGVTYDIHFESDNYDLQTGETEMLGMYGMYIHSAGTRVVIKNHRESTLPADTTFTPSYDFDVFAGTYLAKGAYLRITFTPRITIAKVLEQNITKISETSLFRRYLFQKMFVDGKTVSYTGWRFAVSNGFDYHINTGRMCVAYSGSTTMSEEGSGEDRYSVRLAIFNLADIEGTKKDFPAVTAGETYGNMFVGQAQYCAALWTGDDEVTVVLTVAHTYIGNDTVTGVYARKFTPSTETWGELVKCDISIDNNGTTSVIDLNSVDNSMDNAEAIWAATGCEHPRGRGETSDQPIFGITNCPIKVGDYFYASMLCGNYSHPLLRTQDGVHWEFVCDIPNSDGLNGHVFSPSEEVALCYYNNRLYVSTRGNNGFFPVSDPNNEAGWDTLMYIDWDKLWERDEANWSPIIVLNGRARERTTVVGANGRIYVLDGLASLASNAYDGPTIAKGRRDLRIYDTDLNLLRTTAWDSETGVYHPMFKQLGGGNIIAVSSTDLRCFSINRADINANTRAEIQVSRVDAELLYMTAE